MTAVRTTARSGMPGRVARAVAARLRAGAAAGFSIAELMIALVILGIGLLFIAAALPVGIEFTRKTVDLASGESAGDYAIEQIKKFARTSRKFIPGNLTDPNNEVRLDAFFRPRDASKANEFYPPLAPSATSPAPFFVVRPLIGQNLNLTPPNYNNGYLFPVGDLGEQLLRLAYSSIAGAPLPWRENDDDAFLAGVPGASASLSLYAYPSHPVWARVYPALAPDIDTTASPNLGLGQFEPAQFFAAPYAPRKLLGVQETERIASRRIVWTAFYRRVSYAQDSDPLLYEMIVVVSRRLTDKHRFARQSLTTFNPTLPAAAIPSDLTGSDRLVPEPWLIAFQNPGGGSALPTLPAFTPIFDAQNQLVDRVLDGSVVGVPLTFRCTTEVGRLLPVGSIIIPAVNQPLPQPPGQLVVGFVPHSADTLPIYEVADRPDDNTIVVKANGYWPWVNPPNPEALFLCWVIPPAFTERDASGEPVFERKSPVLSVIRRTIRIPEIP